MKKKPSSQSFRDLKYLSALWTMEVEKVTDVCFRPINERERLFLCSLLGVPQMGQKSRGPTQLLLKGKLDLAKTHKDPRLACGNWQTWSLLASALTLHKLGALFSNFPEMKKIQESRVWETHIAWIPHKKTGHSLSWRRFKNTCSGSWAKPSSDHYQRLAQGSWKPGP